MTVAVGEKRVVDFYLDFETTVVHGHVYAKDGKPVAAAKISGIMSDNDVATAVTDDRGYFRFGKLEAGFGKHFDSQVPALLFWPD